MEQRQYLQQMMLGKLDRYMQTNKIRPPTYTIYKINSRWIKSLSISHDTMKVLEENIRKFQTSHAEISSQLHSLGQGI